MLRFPAIAGLIAVVVSGAPLAGPNAAAIVDSGSTNRPGFRIVIDPSGIAEFTSVPRRFGVPQEQAAPPAQIKPIRRTIPRAIAERFHADLNAAGPLASLPAVHCVKSVSFGSRLTISFGGQQTPDLTCGDRGNAAMRNLIRDANEITALFQAN